MEGHLGASLRSDHRTGQATRRSTASRRFRSPRESLPLGNIASELPTGDRGANLSRALAYFEVTLRVYTASDPIPSAKQTQRHEEHAAD